ncbi:MAG TPA: M1 family aminopeptidase, partial [Saprospiraceae bacterium]|nr:M1 family aminopeptidase [Saprospiraceae bacterium]
LLAHEMAHQWFGDKVTCGSYRDVWLSEGFATYLQGMTVQQFFPADWHSWLKARITSVAGQSGGSVWVEDTTNVARIYSGRLSYNKASYLLHMLRWMIGDSVFFEACRNYLEDPKTSYGFARTSDLQHKLEEASGLDLTEFFADWFTGQGYPSYTIDWYQLQDSVSVGIHQAQSHPAVNFFEMPLPVWLYHNGIPEKLVLPNSHQDQLFMQYVGDVVIDSLVFDPELWILSVNNKVRHLSTATHDITSSDEIHFYPNPANQEIRIINLPPTADVMLIDLQGRQYQLKEYNGLSIDLSSFADGLYWLKVTGPKAALLLTAPILILH